MLHLRLCFAIWCAREAIIGENYVEYGRLKKLFFENNGYNYGSCLYFIDPKCEN